MIFDTQPLVSGPFFFGVIALLALIGLASLFFQSKKGASPKRLLIRSLILLGLIGCLSMAVLRPRMRFAPQENLVLVYQDGLEKSVIDFWRDSLDAKKAVTLSKFKTASGKVVLLGERFSAEELYSLRNVDFKWVQPHKHGSIRALSWKGYLRKGEVQRLHFDIFSDKEAADFELTGSGREKQLLKKGWNTGLLEFIPGGLGKAEFPVVLDADTLTMVRFYIGAALPKKYHFQLGFPGAESRTLSSWLREKGEKVTEEIKLSRETILQTGTAGDSLQILLIDPAQLDQKSVQDAVKGGKTVLLVMNVIRATETAQKLNRLFGTDFQVEQTGQNEDRMLENGVSVLPYSFKEKSAQKLLQERSIAIQYSGNNRIVLNLISASFPLLRQGKADIYEAVWGELFGLLEPDEPQAWKMNAPLLSGISEEIQIFRTDSLPGRLIWERDTLTLRTSTINPHLATADLRTHEFGWMDVDSTFSSFVYGGDELPSLQTAELIREVNASLDQPARKNLIATEPISPWYWIIGILVFLGLMWLEPKLDF